MPTHLSVRDRWRIISLRFDQNMHPPEIASTLNCSRQTVHNIVQLFSETNDVIERERPGRSSTNYDKTHQTLYKKT